MCRKPSELAPSTCLRLASLAEAAGFPPGALNVVTGEGFPTGKALSEHPGVDKVSFTGSVQTGQRYGFLPTYIITLGAGIDMIA